MLTDVRPYVKRRRISITGKQDDPVYNGNEERVCDNGGVKERVQGLQRPREAIDQRSPAQGVGQGVDCGDEEVEAKTPIRKDGEVGEGSAGSEAAAGIVRAGPADDEEARDEDVETLQAAQLVLGVG